MKTAAKLTFAALGFAGLAGLALWWLADLQHRSPGTALSSVLRWKEAQT